MGYTSNWPGNEIAKISKYITDSMDEVFVHELKTAAMKADPRMVEAGRTAKHIYLATPVTNGAGNYSAKKGWTQNKGTLSWESYTLRYDRGASFLIDSLETSQTGGLASVGIIANEFIRQKMVPEIDATRIATASSVAVTAGNVTENEEITKANVLTKITEALDNIYDRTGIDSGITIYLNNKLKSILNLSSEYTRSRRITDPVTGLLTTTNDINGNPIVFVPGNRMYSKIILNGGDEDDGGYAHAGSSVNFLLAVPGAAQGVIAYQNTAILAKGQHTEGDGDFYGYRIFHDCICPLNKRGGLYVSLSGDHDGVQVTYDANGGTGTVEDTKDYIVGDTVTVKKSTGLTPPAGKTFANWNTKADGSGIDRAPDSTFRVEADITLYAKWEDA